MISDSLWTNSIQGGSYHLISDWLSCSSDCFTYFLMNPRFNFKSNYNFSFPAQLFWAHFVWRGICWCGIVASYCSTHSLFLMPATALSYKTSTDITRYFQKHYPWHSLHLFYIHGYSFKSRFSGRYICVGLNWNCS